jgi:6,7-dimethyl-8-ribityllumazine synthase
VRDDDVTLVRVPGAFELPVAAQRLAESGRVDAVICLGCLIKGDTMHFEYIADAATRGISQVGLETGVPVAFGVLTTLTDEQAEGAGAPGRRQQRQGSRARRRGNGDAAPRDRRRSRRMSGRTKGKAAPPIALRHRAREAAVQMLYQWEVGGWRSPTCGGCGLK